jgi:hypothetical protein
MSETVWKETVFPPAVIPALPGFAVASPLTGDDGLPVRIGYLPIIAWIVQPRGRVDESGEWETQFEWSTVRPITPEGEPWEKFLIRTPDNLFILTHDSVFEGETAALEYFRKVAEAERS